MRGLSIGTLQGLALLTAVGTLTIASQGCGSEGPAAGPGGVDAGPGFNVGDGGADFDKCATGGSKAEKQPVDMIIGLDTSFSMDFDSKWTNVRDALKAFTSNPAYSDLGVGLQFFPIRKQCSVADYQVPAVPLSLQPQAAGPIASALDGQEMAGGTPMVPLLEGLTKYLVTSAQPGRKPVIVLATDGVPDDTCLASSNGSLPNTLDNAVAVADGALKGTPSISTFVIGVGGELSALNAIAAAGGTTAATLVDTGGDAQAALLTALDTIRRKAIPCDYDIPQGTLDAQSTNVTYTTKGNKESLVFVGNADGCAKAPNGAGWYFDDEAAPRKVILCAAVCEAVKSDDSGSVDLVFGCPRVGVN